jgi:uncharacterized lipoprotein YmbA
MKLFFLVPFVILLAGCGGKRGVTLSDLENQYIEASRNVWAMELEDNKDHNRDGFIGAPR